MTEGTGTLEWGYYIPPASPITLDASTCPNCNGVLTEFMHIGEEAHVGYQECHCSTPPASLLM